MVLDMQSWIIYSIICLLLWGLWGFVLKIASRGSEWVIVYYLSTIASFILSTIIFILNKGYSRLNTDFNILALIAGLLGSLGYLFFVNALREGEASIVIPLTSIYPAITVILAVLLLGEKISIHQVIGVILALAGIVLLSM